MRSKIIEFFVDHFVEKKYFGERFFIKNGGKILIVDEIESSNKNIDKRDKFITCGQIDYTKNEIKLRKLSSISLVEFFLAYFLWYKELIIHELCHAKVYLTSKQYPKTFEKLLEIDKFFSNEPRGHNTIFLMAMTKMLGPMCVKKYFISSEKFRVFKNNYRLHHKALLKNIISIEN